MPENSEGGGAMKKNRIWQLLFAVYGIVMLWLLFDRVGYEPGIPYTQQLKYNLLPFHTILLFLEALFANLRQ